MAMTEGIIIVDIMETIMVILTTATAITVTKAGRLLLMNNAELKKMMPEGEYLVKKNN
jgi:hypothetical protein